MALTDQDKKRIEEEEKYRAELRGSLSPTLQTKSDRNRIVAALLAVFLGWIGIHKFYLGKPAQGIIYILFAWTAIPAIIGIIEGIIYLTMSDKAFENKYA